MKVNISFNIVYLSDILVILFILLISGLLTW